MITAAMVGKEYPRNTTTTIQGPEWNVADIDSCPSASQVSLDALDMSEPSQSIINGDSSPALNHTTRRNESDDCSIEAAKAAMSLLAYSAGRSTNVNHVKTTMKPDNQVSLVKIYKNVDGRVVDEMNLPPHYEGKPREQKVKHWASHGAMRRYVTVTYPRGLTVNIVRLMHWATHKRNLARVKEVLDQYPVIMDDIALSATSPSVFETSDAEAGKYTWTFVVPKVVVTAMQAAIETYFQKKYAASKATDGGPEEIDLVNSQHDDAQSAVVKLRTNLVFFSSRCVLAMKSFYEVTRLASAWSRDMNWLCQNWKNVQAGPVEFLAKETRSENLVAVSSSSRLDKLAMEVMVKYEVASLASKYSLRSRSAFIHFREVVGAVARTEWLTGAAVNFGVGAICEGRTDCLVLSSHDLDGHFPSDRGLFSYKLVILPVNSHGMHWTLIMVTIDKGSIRALLYDPLNSTTHLNELRNIWKGNMLPFLHRWDKHYQTYADEEGYQFPVHVPNHSITRPTQPDGGSSGIMVLAMVHTYVRVPTRGFELDTVTSDYVKVMWLRFLWLVLCGSLFHATADSDEAATRATDKELLSIYRPSA